MLIVLLSCKGNSKDVNTILTIQQKSFAKDSYVGDLLNFIPEKVNDNNVFFEVFPPACPPTYECSAQFGDIYLNINKESHQDLYEETLKQKFKFKTDYYEENIIINLYELKDSIFHTDKCNISYDHKYPIPHFEDHDFGLGCITEEKSLNGEKYLNYKYMIPNDLIVYVVDAQSGNFWRKDCNEKRPNTLGVWKHGYSKGYAISNVKNMIIFWAMIW
jgi:hypothetical protein